MHVSSAIPLLPLLFPALASPRNVLPERQRILGSAYTHSQRFPLRLAVFGDSWASGVNFGPPDPAVEYNYPDSDEVCRCRRVNEAWPVQLLRDNGTLTQKYRFELDYQACHGAWFGDIADQVRRLNQTKTPDVGFLMIGGNPGGFPKIVEDCIFQFDRNKDYGPEYPDPSGACSKTLEDARRTVHSLGFMTDLLASTYAILNEPRILAKPHFKLYVVSYSNLFNHDDDACNEWSMGLWGEKKPKLTTELRKAIDAVIEDGRKLYDLYLNHLIFDPRVRFLDANQVLEGHRFCEPTQDGTIEQMYEKAWLYHLDWPQCIPLMEQIEDSDDVYADFPGFCRNCGGFAGVGDFQRPFHPRAEGHKAYKSFLIKVLQADMSNTRASGLTHFDLKRRR